MKHERAHYPLRYRRSRSLLYVIGLFWVWLCFGSATLLDRLYSSPLHAALAMYAISVVVLVSLPAAMLAVARMVLSHPRRNAVVVPLPLPRRTRLEPPHWWYGEKAS